jgi:FKBP-type peptidyl-prolyl cis-trans isomerase
MLPLHSPRIGSRLPSGVIRARLLSVATGLACFAFATATAAQQPASNSAQASTPSLSSKIGAQVTDLKKIDVKQGDGAEAVAGKIVVVHYTGWLYDPAAADGHGAKFDSSLDRKTPFEFPLGAHRVIKGWDDGVAGMRVGGKRTLVIPPQMAYGERGAGGVIPPNATLLFDVELLEVKG